MLGIGGEEVPRNGWSFRDDGILLVGLVLDRDLARFR
jgi:hypothetical protein